MAIGNQSIAHTVFSAAWLECEREKKAKENGKAVLLNLRSVWRWPERILGQQQKKEMRKKRCAYKQPKTETRSGFYRKMVRKKKKKNSAKNRKDMANKNNEEWGQIGTECQNRMVSNIWYRAESSMLHCGNRLEKKK